MKRTRKRKMKKKKKRDENFDTNSVKKTLGIPKFTDNQNTA